MKAPASLTAVAVTAALVVGLAAGEHIGSSASHGSTIKFIGVAVFISAIFFRREWRALVAITGAVVLGLSLGGDVVESMSLSESFPTGARQVQIEGVLVDDPGGHPFATSATIETTRVDGKAVHKRVVLRSAGRDSLRLGALRMGDRVGALATLSPLDSDDIYDRRSGVVAQAKDAIVHTMRPPTQLHYVAGAVVRERIEAGASHLLPRDEQLLLGFLLGETRLIDQPTAASFRAAGLTHLLAVSGANVAFVLALVGPLMRRLPTFGRFAVGVGTVIVFASATRFEPSVLRAATMALVVMLARYSGRGVSPGRALAIAVFALLVHDPLIIHSLGFRLSVVATVGIVILAKPIAAAVRWRNPVADALAITVAAEIAVSPMLLIEFGSIPLLAPVANLLAVPVAEPLTIYGMAMSSIVPSLPRRLGEVLMAPCGWMLSWVRTVARTIGDIGLTLDWRGFLCLLAVCAATICWRRKWPVHSQ